MHAGSCWGGTDRRSPPSGHRHRSGIYGNAVQAHAGAGDLAADRDRTDRVLISRQWVLQAGDVERSGHRRPTTHYATKYILQDTATNAQQDPRRESTASTRRPRATCPVSDCCRRSSRAVTRVSIRRLKRFSAYGALISPMAVRHGRPRACLVDTSVVEGHLPGPSHAFQRCGAMGIFGAKAAGVGRVPILSMQSA